MANLVLLPSISPLEEVSSCSSKDKDASGSGEKKVKKSKKKPIGCFGIKEADGLCLVGLPPPVNFSEDGEAVDFRDSLTRIRNALLHAQKYAPGYAIERSSVGHNNDNITDLASTAASHDAPSKQGKSKSSSINKEPTIDDHEVDTDVPTLLEQMNEACADINTHEGLLTQAQRDHKRTLDDWSSCIEAWKVKLESSGLRKCTHYAEAVENMHGIHMALHHAVRNFSRATAKVDEARAQLAVAEKASKSPSQSPAMPAQIEPSRESTGKVSVSTSKNSNTNDKITSRQGSRQLDLVSSEAVASAVVALQEATLERDRLDQVISHFSL